ncbi:hypothetical protein OPV22_008805 [Ensete ventricosum]|uniref:Uncharacterized protein n=1 Tax=Ensete ventricosum TaxID=4639 RepID=A0AAV8RHE2_ENSVE|nr:hypothetical protein OPV22_008805 [Ensete ventricosum]
MGKLAPLALSILFFLVLSSLIPSTEAYDSLDPNGNITIKWDIMQWTPDGYVAVENNSSSHDMECYICVEGDSPYLASAINVIDAVWRHK